MVISGPNTGGKTVALKSVGLFSIMAQAGLPVPAEDAQLPIFHQVLADIGDHQSISRHLSTFSAHILRMKTMAESLHPPSLILLDELGTGTDPIYGAALGIAILDFFRRHQGIVLATTHQPAIKSFASTTPGVNNASVEWDTQTLRPTYSLKLGVTGVSNALEVAAQLELPNSIVRQARERLDRKESQAEHYLRQLRHELQSVDQMKEQLRLQIQTLKEKDRQKELDFEQREQQRQQESEKALSCWAADFKAETGRFIKTIQDGRESARLRRKAKSRETLLKEVFRRRMTSSPGRQAGVSAGTGADSNRVREGDWVYHAYFRKDGRVVAIQNGEAIVEIAGKKIASPMDQVKKTDQSRLATELPRVTLHVVE